MDFSEHCRFEGDLISPLQSKLMFGLNIFLFLICSKQNYLPFFSFCYVKFWAHRMNPLKHWGLQLCKL